jgi:hypothetical protein
VSLLQLITNVLSGPQNRLDLSISLSLSREHLTRGRREGFQEGYLKGAREGSRRGELPEKGAGGGGKERGKGTRTVPD